MQTCPAVRKLCRCSQIPIYHGLWHTLGGLLWCSCFWVISAPISKSSNRFLYVTPINLLGSLKLTLVWSNSENLLFPMLDFYGIKFRLSVSTVSAFAHWKLLIVHLQMISIKEINTTIKISKSPNRQGLY